MKRIFLTLLAVLACALTVRAQDSSALEALAQTLSSGEVRFHYTFEVKGDVPVKGSGAVSLLGDAYRIIGNEMEIWCNGTTRWTVDRNAREAYVETVEKESTDYLANPATLLGALTRVFEVRTVSDVTLGGKKLKSIQMSPSVGDTGLRDVSLYLNGSIPERVIITVEDGTQTLFRISGFTAVEKSDADYIFDIASLGSDYVVTDLR